MTKDWDSVRPTIRQLSVEQKKSLQEVKSVMEKEHHFRASTRAYRMKLREWGYMRHKRRNTAINRGGTQDGKTGERNEGEGTNDSDTSATFVEGNTTLEEEAQDLIPIVDPWVQGRTMTTNIVMEMLEAVLEGDSEKLERKILLHPGHLNYPIGLPFDARDGRFFNHPAIQQCIILQHPDQKLLDIASALPTGPVLYVLIAHGAEGSTHPLGTDLAFQNAIKNGRTYTVQGLLQVGRSHVNGNPGVTWRPLLQAAFWNVPDIVRVLLDRGAKVNETAPTGPTLDSTAPALDEVQFPTALQLALHRRANSYMDRPVRERTEQILKMLLDAGADIHVPPAEGSDGLTPFELFIAPWQTHVSWATDLSETARECLEAFIRKGAHLKASFVGLPCSASTGNTFMHQMLWHTTTSMARLLVDHAVPTPEADGAYLLHEIVGCCPHTKRHPLETLRDIEILLNKGADPNMMDENGSTPLTACIERCPSGDIVNRLTLLLEKGADPELRSANSLQPVVFAARSFEEPLLSQVMEIFLHKYRGRRPNLDHSTWAEGYLPIPDDPTFMQVLSYSGHSADFEASMQQMLPEDIVPIFRNAAFSVASKNYLDSVTTRRRLTQEFRLTVPETDEIKHIISLRQARALPAYKFDQDFVMGLLMSSLETVPISVHPSSIPDRTGASVQLHGQTPASSLGLTLDLPTPSDANMLGALPADTTRPSSSTRRGSASSGSSDDSVSSFFVPTTTQIRWTASGRATRPGDQEKANAAVLRYTCKSCNDGLKMTAAENKRHDEEHWHTITCREVGCQRRFCVAERG